MKTIFAILALIMVSACTSAPKHLQWTVDPNDKPALAKFVTVYRDCADFAYRQVVAGSRYGQTDIHYSCVQRQGYDFKMVDQVQAYAE